MSSATRRTPLDYRVELNLVMSVCVAWLGSRLLPYPAENALLRLIALQRRVSLGLEFAYIALWTSTAFLTLSVLTSVIYICAARTAPELCARRCRRTPPSAFARNCFWLSGNAITQPRQVPPPRPRG